VCVWVCFLNSALFHGCDPAWADSFNVLDHMGIFLMIAGTVTPIALVVLKGRWRVTVLVGIWIFALVGMGTRVWLDLPLAARTAYYVLMGWVGCVTYFQLARRLGHRKVAPIWLGGLFYTLGATLNVLGWPTLLPGFFGPHELFHLFVMAGSLAHFYFMLVVLVPCWRVPFVIRKPARTSPDFPVSPGVEFADSGVRS
jgi:hemolysin III